jgi:mxaJ protein
VEHGDVDVAVVWGPLAGYFAAQENVPLALEPVQPWRDDGEVPMAFDISMGVRRDDNALLQQLDESLEKNHVSIAAILASFHVPVLREPFAAPGLPPR